MPCEVASWIPTAVGETLRASSAIPSAPVVAWLSVIRAATEEYDPLVLVRPPSAHSEDSGTSTATPDSAFDDILSQLGKEIFKLEEYQRNLLPDEREVSLSILNIFDECLEDMTEVHIPLDNSDHGITDVTRVTMLEDSNVNGNVECSDSESTVSDISYVTSTLRTSMRASERGLDSTPGGGAPVPAPRTRLKAPRTLSMAPENGDVKPVSEGRGALGSECDSDSTCWSYRECSSDGDGEGQGQGGRARYAEVWAHSSGFQVSDAIMRSVLAKNYAVVSRLSFESTGDLQPAEYSAYSLRAPPPPPEVGDRCAGAGAGQCRPAVATMTPGPPRAAAAAAADDGYEPVRDALPPAPSAPSAEENIYEEIEYGYSYTDEGCSCGGSVDVESCSISASSEGVGRESPFYANLRDHDAYAITPDVLFWKNLLLDPLYNDDEEDEWITPEEYAVYSREQRPPLVIPRISQCRAPRPRPPPQPPSQYQYQHHQLQPAHHYHEESVRFEEFGAVCERGPRCRERSFVRAADSPPFGRLDKRLGTSTENLLTPRRPQHLHLPPSSSGDSLDFEVRDKEGSEYSRSRKSRSMVAPKPRKSPVPAPRTTVQSEAAVIYEGPVKRTKYMESSKKTKKNWTDCYMLLTTTGLIFYKDQKTYLASKAGRAAGSPGSAGAGGGAGGGAGAARAELVLPLRNAHVQPCCNKHTRRYTRSLVLLVNYDQYLIQDESEESAGAWLRYIQTVIYNLGPPEAPPVGGSATPQLSSGTDLESLGRTPPPHRHHQHQQQRGKAKAGGSSNEDLSDSTEKSHIKSKIRKFLNKRPSKEVLMTKGIWKDEPVFGRNLEKVCPESSPRVPAFVVACVREIESSEENMCTDGLYRASGNLSQVQKIRLEVDQNNLKVVEESTDIHVLTGSLKLFFRELKEPVIPCHMFDRVLAACSIKPREAKIKEFREIVQALPECNRDTLKFLLEHLLKVTKYSERNRMHTANLAIVFGPTLLWAPAEQAHNIAIDCIQQNNVVETLLNDFKEIFVEGKKKA